MMAPTLSTPTAATPTSFADAPATASLLLRGVGVGLLSALALPRVALEVIAATAAGLRDAVAVNDDDKPIPVAPQLLILKP